MPPIKSYHRTAPYGLAGRLSTFHDKLLKMIVDVLDLMLCEKLCKYNIISAYYSQFIVTCNGLLSLIRDFLIAVGLGTFSLKRLLKSVISDKISSCFLTTV